MTDEITPHSMLLDLVGQLDGTGNQRLEMAAVAVLTEPDVAVAALQQLDVLQRREQSKPHLVKAAKQPKVDRTADPEATQGVQEASCPDCGLGLYAYGGGQVCSYIPWSGIDQPVNEGFVLACGRS